MWIFAAILLVALASEGTLGKPNPEPPLYGHVNSHHVQGLSFQNHHLNAVPEYFRENQILRSTTGQQQQLHSGFGHQSITQGYVRGQPPTGPYQPTPTGTFLQGTLAGLFNQPPDSYQPQVVSQEQPPAIVNVTTNPTGGGYWPQQAPPGGYWPNDGGGPGGYSTTGWSPSSNGFTSVSNLYGPPGHTAPPPVADITTTAPPPSRTQPRTTKKPTYRYSSLPGRTNAPKTKSQTLPRKKPSKKSQKKKNKSQDLDNTFNFSYIPAELLDKGFPMYPRLELVRNEHGIPTVIPVFRPLTRVLNETSIQDEINRQKNAYGPHGAFFHPGLHGHFGQGPPPPNFPTSQNNGLNIFSQSYKPSLQGNIPPNNRQQQTLLNNTDPSLVFNGNFGWGHPAVPTGPFHNGLPASHATHPATAPYPYTQNGGWIGGYWGPPIYVNHTVLGNGEQPNQPQQSQQADAKSSKITPTTNRDKDGNEVEGEEEEEEDDNVKENNREADSNNTADENEKGDGGNQEEEEEPSDEENAVNVDTVEEGDEIPPEVLQQMIEEYNEKNKNNPITQQEQRQHIVDRLRNQIMSLLRMFGDREGEENPLGPGRNLTAESLTWNQQLRKRYQLKTRNF